jgi:hypothetical protein
VYLELQELTEDVFKMAIDYRDGVTILKLIVYLPHMLASIYVCCRHYFRRNSGWVFLVIFCILRIIGPYAQLATINNGSSTLYTIAAITDAIGLSPLLLSSFGLISRMSVQHLPNAFCMA